MTVGVGITAILFAVICLTWISTRGHAASYTIPRDADGHPDLNGIWQALNTANWNLQDHAAGQGPVASLGAVFSIPGGLGVVEGNDIPYQRWAAAKQKENAANWIKLDPEVKCYLPGVPRFTYIPFPFQILQTSQKIIMVSEYAAAVRTIHLQDPDEPPIDTWMGHSHARWNGETLIVDVAGLNGQTWLDRAGNFVSETAHITERYTAQSSHHLLYEAVIEDPKVFTRPWKIRMPLYRRMEQDAQLLDYKCVEFAEELLYGHLRKK